MSGLIMVCLRVSMLGYALVFYEMLQVYMKKRKRAGKFKLDLGVQ